MNKYLILSPCRAMSVKFVGMDFTLQLDIMRKLTELINIANQIVNVI
jgi:hypothetical protein